MSKITRDRRSAARGGDDLVGQCRRVRLDLWAEGVKRERQPLGCMSTPLAGCVGSQRRAVAQRIGHQLEVPDLVRVDLTEPELGAIAH